MLTLPTLLRSARMLVAAVVLGAAMVPLTAPAQQAAGAPKVFATSDEAINTLVATARTGDMKAVYAIFGNDMDSLMTGDRVEDSTDFQEFVAAITTLCNPQKISDDKIVLNVGAENWPFPIPLERTNGAWNYNTRAGKDEMVARNIGEDELNTINVCRAFVRAQQEYFAQLHDSSNVHQYAHRFRSSEGKHNGLYWEPAEGEQLSPFGPLVADAQAEGYTDKPLTKHRRPFHGYFFKNLAAQGPDAPGGAYSYIINGYMVGGFAMVAYPAQWGASGIMTFIVNQQGKVYQCNLGENTASVVDAMTEFNLDGRWLPVDESTKK